MKNILFTIDKHNSRGGYASRKDGLKAKKVDVKISPTILSGYATRFGDDNCPAVIEVIKLSEEQKEQINEYRKSQNDPNF